jgi:hypothetical protein
MICSGNISCPSKFSLKDIPRLLEMVKHRLMSIFVVCKLHMKWWFSWMKQVLEANVVCSVQVAAHFDDIITKPLLTGALETFKRYSCSKGYSYRDMSLCMNPLCFSFAGCYDTL